MPQAGAAAQLLRLLPQRNPPAQAVATAASAAASKLKRRLLQLLLLLLVHRADSRPPRIASLLQAARPPRQRPRSSSLRRTTRSSNRPQQSLCCLAAAAAARRARVRKPGLPAPVRSRARNRRSSLAAAARALRACLQAALQARQQLWRVVLSSGAGAGPGKTVPRAPAARRSWCLQRSPRRRQNLAALLLRVVLASQRPRPKAGSLLPPARAPSLLHRNRQRAMQQQRARLLPLQLLPRMQRQQQQVLEQTGLAALQSLLQAARSLPASPAQAVAAHARQPLLLAGQLLWLLEQTWPCRRTVPLRRRPRLLQRPGRLLQLSVRQLQRQLQRQLGPHPCCRPQNPQQQQQPAGQVGCKPQRCQSSCSCR